MGLQAVINNNIDMIESLKDPWDYVEYVAKCDELSVRVNDKKAYFMGLGALLGSKRSYPELSSQEAYGKILADPKPAKESTQVSHTASGCCGDKGKTPNIVTKGFNFAKALTEHIITGMQHVEPVIYIYRLDICRTCPSRQEGFVCSECGCYMGIKASWLDQKCGLKKW